MSCKAANQPLLSRPGKQLHGMTQFTDRSTRCFGQIAQLVEHRTENPGVGGSIPPLPIQN